MKFSKRYTVVASDNLEDLIRGVNDLFKDDWDVCGGIQATTCPLAEGYEMIGSPDPDHWFYMMYCQSMFKMVLETPERKGDGQEESQPDEDENRGAPDGGGSED